MRRWKENVVVIVWVSSIPHLWSFLFSKCGSLMELTWHSSTSVVIRGHVMFIEFVVFQLQSQIFKYSIKANHKWFRFTFVEWTDGFLISISVHKCHTAVILSHGSINHDLRKQNENKKTTIMTDWHVWEKMPWVPTGHINDRKCVPGSKSACHGPPGWV